MTAKQRPADHADRLARAAHSLAGLWTGDAFGQQFFYLDREAMVAERTLPNAPWRHTDDTEMALAIVEVLQHHGRVDQDDLAETFAERYRRDSNRGYGAMAHEILAGIARGMAWRLAAGQVFNGQGSMGNGSAMRVAPVGAYFADDYAAVTREAIASAEVTHANPEAKAGAAAIALAAAWSWRHRHDRQDSPDYWDVILDHVTDSETRRGIQQAQQLPADLSPIPAAGILGNGMRVTCPDTVPITLWLANKYRDDYEEALWQTIAIGGDIDTNAAIVGGIVIMNHDLDAIPAAWTDARE